MSLVEEYIFHNYRTLDKRKVDELFNCTKLQVGRIVGALYRTNSEAREFMNKRVIELRKTHGHLEVARIMGINYNIVCDICNGITTQDKKEKRIIAIKPKISVKKERYYNFIKKIYEKHKKKIFDLKTTCGDDYKAIGLLELEGKIKILSPTENDLSIRIEYIGG